MPKKGEKKSLASELLEQLGKALTKELAHHQSGKSPHKAVKGGVADLVTSWRERAADMQQEGLKSLADQQAEAAANVNKLLTERAKRLAALEGGDVALGEAPASGAVIGGRLTDKGSGQPLAQAMLVLVKGTGSKRVELSRTLSDPHGLYRFELDQAALNEADKASGDVAIEVLGEGDEAELVAKTKTSLTAGRAVTAALEVKAGSLPKSLARGELGVRRLQRDREALERRRKALTEHRAELKNRGKGPVVRGQKGKRG